MRVVVMLTIGCVLSITLGCAPKGTAINPDTRTPVANDPAPAQSDLPEWFPRAVDLEVHPATRYVREADTIRLEARIELIDQFGEPIKDIGTLRFELGEVDEEGNLIEVDGQPRRLRWTEELLTEEDQRKRWDPVSRCYLVPLNLDEADFDLPAGQTRLWVTFRPAWPGSAELPTNAADREPVEVRVDW